MKSETAVQIYMIKRVVQHKTKWAEKLSVLMMLAPAKINIHNYSNNNPNPYYFINTKVYL